MIAPSKCTFLTAGPGPRLSAAARQQNNKAMMQMMNTVVVAGRSSCRRDGLRDSGRRRRCFGGIIAKASNSSSSSSSSSGGEDERMTDALIETGEILHEAEQLAKEQTMRELMDLQAADGSSGDNSSTGSFDGATSLLPVELGRGSEASFPEAVRALHKALLARGFPTGDPSGVFGRQTEAALKEFQKSEDLKQSGVLDSMTMDALMLSEGEKVYGGMIGQMEKLRHFWREEGLSSERDIERLVVAVSSAAELQGREVNMDVIFAKLQRLRRLLPQVDVVKMAVQEPEVLDMDLGDATSNLLLLLEALPGQDVPEAVASFPAVLLMTDLKQRLQVTLARIERWSHQSIKHRVLADNLHFLRRVPDYYTEKEFGDLPIDIANSMTVGGGGGGTYFKSWSGFVDRNTD